MVDIGHHIEVIVKGYFAALVLLLASIALYTVVTYPVIVGLCVGAIVGLYLLGLVVARVEEKTGFDL